MKYVLFDLDGTITDPFLGITKSVAYSLHSFGVEVENLESLKRFIGPPLDVSFQEYYHMSVEESFKAIEKFREYFSTKGIFENEVYEGMRDFLKCLNDQGKILYICTSKPVVYAKQIMEHFQLDMYFQGIYGSELDGTRKNKKDVIAYCLAQEDIHAQDCIMVGDRQHDVIGAHENHIPCIGVLYGYGSQEEFENCQCDVIVSTLQELEDNLLD